MAYLCHVVTLVCLYASMAMSLNVVVGFAGQPNIGHAAFVCVGAYVSAILSTSFGIPPLLCAVLAAIIGSAVGAVASAPTMRLKGDYLALATFGAAVVVHGLARNWVALTHGPMGIPNIPPVSVGTIVLSSPETFCAAAAAYTAGTFLFCRMIVNSPFGLTLRAIREDETVVRAVGTTTSNYKVLAFAVSGAIAGMAGSLFAHYFAFIDPSSFTPMDSVVLLLMVALGGLGSLSGSVLAALVLIAFPEALRFVGIPSAVLGPIRQMIYGALLVVLMLWRPQGLLGEYRWG